jgi:hypothetical protein
LRSWQIGIFVTAVAIVAGGVRFAGSGGLAATAKATLAGLLAAGVLVLAASLVTRADLRGLVVGGLFAGAGVLSWTYTDRPLVVWAVLGVEAVVFAVWSWPWLAGIRPGVRLGTAWLGIAYWLLGVVGALLVAHWRIAAERLLYAGVFALAVLAVLAGSRLRDLSAGVAAAFVFILGALLLAGSGNLFEATHVVPHNAWGKGFEYRFWGGEHLLYQPNSMAALAVVAAVRVAADRAFAVWQRLAVTALAAFVVYVSNSRTGFVILAAAAVAHAALLWWRTRRDVAGLPEYGGPRRTVAAAGVPFLMLAVILVLAGPGFLTQSRYHEGDVTSGRTQIWKQVVSEWRHASVAEQVFGDARTTRAVVKLAGGDGTPLTVDNAALSALRRGGVLGVVAFCVGLALLLWHAYRRDAPAWFIVAVLASLPPILSSDALLGGTGGTVWALLLAGESHLVSGAATEVGALLSAGRTYRQRPASAAP